MTLKQSFALVPAAGHSIRMGTAHKLLLPWNESTVIDQLLNAWTASRATRIIVIVRHADVAMQNACRKWAGVDLVVPDDDPQDMRSSIQLGLEHIAEHLGPREFDRWMVAPADLPTLQTQLIDQVINLSLEADGIVVPRFGDRRGHPVSFPWTFSPEVFKLGDHQGINSLLAHHPVRWLELSAGEYPADIDTPEDYERLSNQ
jgi:molybdenum cofactor cytidylyltransferase